MIAICGLNCDTCEIHLATLETDKSKQWAMRKFISEQISKLYGMKLQPHDVNDCDGCKANTARLFSGCEKCEIRKCAIVKEIENCAFCADYACDKLLRHFSLDGSAKERLDTLRKGNE